MKFLPKEGVQGTLYICREPNGKWMVMTWNKFYFRFQGAEHESIEEARTHTDTLLWAKDWPRIECKTPTTKMNPCVRVEFEYADGRIQRLTGDDAKLWMKEVDGVIGMTHLRYSTPPLSDHPWVWLQKPPEETPNK